MPRTVSSPPEQRAPDLSAEALHDPPWLDAARRVPREELVVPWRGVDLRAYAWGDRALPGLVITHGFMAHAMCLWHVAALLSGRFRVVAYDLAGMGDSPLPADFDTSERGEELLAVADATGIDANGAPFLVSHSQGGHSAMSAIELAPERFRALLLTDMMMLPEEAVGSRMKTRERLRGGVRPHRVYATWPEIRARFKLAPAQPCANPVLLEEVAWRSVRELDDGGFTWKFDPRVLVTDGHDAAWWMAQPERFARLKLPRAIVYGENSQVFDQRSVRLMSELTGGRVPIVGIPEAHHHLMLDQPLAFVAALRALLSSWSCASEVLPAVAMREGEG